MPSSLPIAITGLGIATSLGRTLLEHEARLERGLTSFRPLSKLYPDASFGETRGAWVPREWLAHRKFGPASNLARLCALAAVEEAGIEPPQLQNAGLFLGTSRGNAAGWLEPWPGHRPFGLLAASNSIHSEPAAAVSLELGIQGPWQVQASGCSASLDALGLALLHLRAGLLERALVVGVDLPIVRPLLETYARSGVLAQREACDPYDPGTDGFHPGEAGAALLLETLPASQARSHPQLLGYWANSDAANLIGSPAEGEQLAALYQQALQELARTGQPPAHLCPHANGTQSNRRSESAALALAFPEQKPTLHLLKPFTGHSVGASGLVETVLLAHYLRRGLLPPNLAGRTSLPGAPLPGEPVPVAGTVLNTAISMGGHNATVALAAAESP
ncbi:MAG: beta-ketoacyl synthase N-terminal-like domain-containing protein [Verrucomicrobiota bacterium]